jgi:hypothetical protein
MDPYEFEARKLRLQRMIDAELARRKRGIQKYQRVQKEIFSDDSEDYIDAEWCDVVDISPHLHHPVPRERRYVPPPTIPSRKVSDDDLSFYTFLIGFGAIVGMVFALFIQLLSR